MHEEQSDQAHTANGEPIPDPGSGAIPGADEPMTGPQHTYLRALCEEAGEEFDGSLTSAQAGQRIEELESRLPAHGLD